MQDRMPNSWIEQLDNAIKAEKEEIKNRKIKTKVLYEYDPIDLSEKIENFINLHNITRDRLISINQVVEPTTGVWFEFVNYEE